MLYKGEGIEITPEIFRTLKVGDILSSNAGSGVFATTYYAYDMV